MYNLKTIFGRLWAVRTNTATTTAAVLGLVLGIILKFTVTLSKRDKYLSTFPGELFMRMLHVVTTNLLVSGVMTGVARLKLRSSGRIAFRASAYIVLTTLLSVTLALILALSIKPGVNSLNKEHPEDSNDFYFLDALLDLVRTLIPEDPILDLSRMQKTMRFKVEANEQNLQQDAVRIERRFIQGTNILGMTFWAGIFGLFLDKMGGPAESLLEGVAVFNRATYIVVHWILCLFPFAIVFMVTGIVVQADDWEIAIKLGQFIGVVVFGLIIHGSLVLPLTYFLRVRRNPYALIKDIFPALKTAFVTPSSSASNTNRNGTVIYEVVAAVFIAQVHRINWDFGTLIMIALTSAVPSIGGAGTPARGAAAIFFLLTVVDVPGDEVGLLVLVHCLLHRCNTVINVLGDYCIGVALVDRASTRDTVVMEEPGQEMESLEDELTSQAPSSRRSRRT